MGLGPLLVTALAILTSLVAAVAVGAAPSDPSRVAIVFPPWWTATRAVTAAASAGQILDLGGVPFVVIVHRDPATAARHARLAGALFILGADPRSLCSPAALDSKS
jgi:hypothetical protein